MPDLGTAAFRNCSRIWAISVRNCPPAEIAKLLFPKSNQWVGGRKQFRVTNLPKLLPKLLFPLPNQ
jgi:hypothetical protein